MPGLRRTLLVLAASVSVAGATLVATASGAQTAGAQSSGAWSGRVLRLGAIFSTTGAGTAYGPQQVKGARLAVDEINAAGGIRGARLQLTIEDDGSQPSRSAEEMSSLIESGRSLAVLGPTFSNSAAQADPVANQLRTTVLAVSNTGPGIVGTCSYPCGWVFRDSLGEASALPANVGAYVDSAHPTTAVVLYPQGDAYAASTSQIAVQSFHADGVNQVSSVEIIEPGGEAAAVTQALAQHPDVLMITASSSTVAGTVIQAARSQGFSGGILGGNAFNSPATQTVGGAASAGAQSAAGWFAGASYRANRAFVTAYRRRYGEAPDQFSALAFTGVELLAAALRHSPLTFTSLAHDRAVLRPALARVQLATVSGPFRFTHTHDVYQPVWVVALNGHGGYTLVRQLPPSASLPPTG